MSRLRLSNVLWWWIHGAACALVATGCGRLDAARAQVRRPTAEPGTVLVVRGNSDVNWPCGPKGEIR